MGRMLLIDLQKHNVFIFTACRKCPARFPVLWRAMSAGTWEKSLPCIVGFMPSFGPPIHREDKQLPKSIDQKHSRGRSGELWENI